MLINFINFVVRSSSATSSMSFLYIHSTGVLESVVWEDSVYVSDPGLEYVMDLGLEYVSDMLELEHVSDIADLDSTKCLNMALNAGNMEDTTSMGNISDSSLAVGNLRL